MEVTDEELAIAKYIQSSLAVNTRLDEAMIRSVAKILAVSAGVSDPRFDAIFQAAKNPKIKFVRKPN